MDQYSRDKKNEYGGASVDDILADYREEKRAAAAQARYDSYLDEASSASREAAMDDEGVKVYRPKNAPAEAPAPAATENFSAYAGETPAEPVRRRGAVAAMEDEARGLLRGLGGAGRERSQSRGGAMPRADRDRARRAPAERGEYSVEAPSKTESAGKYAEDINYDPLARYDLGEEVSDAMNYDGGEVEEESVDEPTAAAQEASIPSHWGSADGEYAPEEYDGGRSAPKSRRGKGKKGKKKKKRPLNAPIIPDNEEDGDYASEFRDYGVTPGGYAPSSDYAFDRDEEERSARAERGVPSFGQYVTGMFTNVLVRMRGYGKGTENATMDEDDEDLGQELSAASASKYYGSFVHSLRLRFRICLALLAVMAYITLGLPLAGMLKTLSVQAAMCLACQLAVMLLSLDVVTGAAVNLARGRFGADSLAVFACLLSSIDALSVAVGGFGDAHMPLCLISSLSLTGILLSSLLSARGLRKALRVPAIGKRAYTVTCESGVKGAELPLLKSVRSAAGFVRRAEEAAPDETAYLRAAPLLLIVSLLLSAVVAAVQHSFGNFLFILTAILSPAVPLTALLCFALPFFIGSMRIFSSGAAIAGWSGLCDIGQSRSLIVTDRDLFPDGSAEIESIRIFADAPAEKIIGCAGTMIVASGSSIASCFGELMEKNGCRPRHVEGFEYLAGGGMKGIVDGQVVLCGSTDLMRLMNVRVPFRLVDRTTVLLAIDGVLYGIFNMKYTAEPQVRKALVNLMRSNRHPIFAIRDFNITPEMLHQSFDLATDGYDFPPYVERFSISEAKPAEDSKISGVICREGLGPLTNMADTGRSMFIASRINLMLTLLAAAVGVITVFVKLLTAGYVGAGFLLVFMLLWALPVVAVSVFLKF